MNRPYFRFSVMLLAVLALTATGFIAAAPAILLQIDPTQQQATVDAAVEQLFTATADARITATVDAAFQQAVAGTAAALATSTPTITPTSTATMTPEPFNVDRVTVETVHGLDLLAGPVRTGAFLAPDGQKFAYLKGDQICVYTLTGEEQKCIAFVEDFKSVDTESIHWSPDSRYLVLTSDFLRFFVEPDLYLIDTERGSMRNITNDFVLKFSIGNMDSFAGWIDLAPQWVGDMIYFIRYTQTAGVYAPPSLWRVQANGMNPERVGTFSSLDRFSIYAFAVSPDGTQVAYNFYYGSADDRRNGVWLSNLNGSNAKQLLHVENPQFVPWTLDFSPDGRYLLAVTGAGGAFSSVPKPEDSPTYVISVADGKKINIDPDAYVFSAGWSPTGSALVYAVHDLVNADNEGLYVTDAPGVTGRLLENGSFVAPTPRVSHPLAWTANNVILASNVKAGQTIILELGEK